MRGTLKDRLFLFYLVFAVLLFAGGALIPAHNWDMVGYIAAAKSFDTSDPETLRAFTYRSLKESLPEAQYRSMTYPDGDEPYQVYRRAITDDAGAFKEMTSFYRIRPAYTGLIYLLHRIGVKMVPATSWVSATAAALGVVMLYFVASNRLPRLLMWVLPPLAAAFGLIQDARCSSPDALAFLAVMVGTYGYLYNRRLAWVVLPLSIAVRTDLLLFCAPMLLWMIVSERSGRAWAAASLVAAVGAYAFIGQYFHHPGWWVVLHYTVVTHFGAPHPAITTPSFSLGAYLDILRQGIASMPKDEVFVFYAVVASAFAALAGRRWLRDRRACAAPTDSRLTSLGFLCIVYVAAHFVLFPETSKRFFVAVYTLQAVCLLATAVAALTPSLSSGNEQAPHPGEHA